MKLPLVWGQAHSMFRLKGTLLRLLVNKVSVYRTFLIFNVYIHPFIVVFSDGGRVLYFVGT